MARIPVAFQMYTLRNEAANDFVGTIRKAAEIGYEGIEETPPANVSAKEYKALLDDLGLKSVGGHVGLEALEQGVDKHVDFYLEVGSKYLTVPYLGENRRKTADDWKGVAASMSGIAAKLAEHDITFCYHNHSFEFQKFGGEYGLDIFYDAASDQVQAELDTYWVKHGGEDPASYIRKYAGRAPLIHIKDMGADGSFAEIGEGTLDWASIWNASESSGAAWYIVEQDTCKRPPIESVALSLKNLRGMGKID
ncbi:MAG: sugar phosphate isomerase/epimerase [Candidatus Poribacteria bacterium]|nr:sugar phosphate isomerase/epimerase [Candidatus Poribacteria bacterium]